MSSSPAILIPTATLGETLTRATSPGDKHSTLPASIAPTSLYSTQSTEVDISVALEDLDVRILAAKYPAGDIFDLKSVETFAKDIVSILTDVAEAGG